MIRSAYGDRVFDSESEIRTLFADKPVDLSVREMEIANRQFGVAFYCENGKAYLERKEENESFDEEELSF